MAEVTKEGAAKAKKVAVKTETQVKLEAARKAMQEAMAAVKELNAARKAELNAMREARAAATSARKAKTAATQAEREAKRAAAIKRAEERLAKLKAQAMGPVGHKAAKAARKPGKVTVTKPQA